MLLSLLSRRSLEVDSRDTYGFALRPQHVQRYREYLSIYKEEEAERAEKWKSFLERQDGPTELCSSEEESQITLRAEAPELGGNTSSEEDFGVSDSRTKSHDIDYLSELGHGEESQHPDRVSLEARRELSIKREPTKEETQLQTDHQDLKGDQTGRESESEEGLSQEPETEKDKQLSGKSEPEEGLSEQPEIEKDKQLSGKSEPEEGLSEQPETETDKQFSGKSEPEEGLSEEPETEKDKQLSGKSEPEEGLSEEPETEKDKQLSGKSEPEEGLSEEPEAKKDKRLSGKSEPEEEQQLTQISKAVDQLQLRQENESEKCVSAPEDHEHGHEKDGQKETKTRKVQEWAHIRPSLGSIETMMCYRVKKTKYMKAMQSAPKRGSINKSMPSIEESEENFVEHAPDSESSTSTSHARKEENDSYESGSPKPSFPLYEELEVLVRLGVPKDLRGEIWQAFVGVKARRVERYYQDMLAQITNSDESEENACSSDAFRKWKKQIEKDIPRTFPGHPALNDHGRDSLRRILLAYACHNPTVGYCQAMNFFAGLLLLLMPEENAFWTFVGVIDDYFDGYYTEEMIESQVDQLVFEELIRERFPKLVNHLDYLGVQVAWISGPWFLSIFVNVLPWESVLRVWDVLLFEGNRVMLFCTALALMELYGPAVVATKDAGDAITLIQTLSGSTFDSSQLVLTACMGYLSVTEARLKELREKRRPEVVEVVEERTKRGRVWKDKKGLASKLYSFKHERSILDEQKSTQNVEDPDHGKSGSQHHSSNPGDILDGENVDSELDSLPDLQEQVVWMKVELCRLLEEKRSAVLRAEELEIALMEMVKVDNRLELCARIEQLEQEVRDLKQVLADKKEQESAMLKVLMKVEQEQRLTEDARLNAEHEVASQKYAVHILQDKYEKATAQLAEMEKRLVMTESTLQATLQYESGQNKALSSPRFTRTQQESPKKRTGLLSFGFGWRNKGKQPEDSNDENSSNLASSPNSPSIESVSRQGSNRESNLSKESKAEDLLHPDTKS